MAAVVVERSGDIYSHLIRPPSHSKLQIPVKSEQEIDLKSAQEVERRLTSLWQLLTKSETVGGAYPAHPDFLEYRQRNLQWRTGLAQGSHGEVADIGISKPQDEGFGGSRQLSTGTDFGFLAERGDMQRCASWPYLPKLDKSPRKIWMFSAELESDIKAVYPQMWQRLQSHAGLLLQVIVLLLVTNTYAACPLTVSWAKMLGTGEDGLPVKGRPFKEGSVIIVSWAMIASMGLLLSAATGGVRSVRQCFNWRTILLFAPAGIGWALADVCEVLAVARIDPATYGVISQARLLGSAGACWLIRGMSQNRLQWGILVSLSLVCMAYCFIPDTTTPNSYRLFQWRMHNGSLLTLKVKTPLPEETTSAQEQMVGAVFALLKVTLSVLSGVYGESCFKVAGADGRPTELHVQMTQVSFSSILAAFAGYWAICTIQEEDPREFFSGPDGSWTYRTLAVAAMYCWREWICNFCVKRFDSLVKNICNAVSLVVTYCFTVLVAREKDFSALKVLLLLAIVMEVVNYCMTRWRGPSSEKAAEMAEEIPVAEYKALSRGQSVPKLSRDNSIDLKDL